MNIESSIKLFIPSELMNKRYSTMHSTSEYCYTNIITLSNNMMHEGGIGDNNMVRGRHGCKSNYLTISSG